VIGVLFSVSLIGAAYSIAELLLRSGTGALPGSRVGPAVLAAACVGVVLAIGVKASIG
jgi:hypothetical protein